jgi:hypothetical protein
MLLNNNGQIVKVADKFKSRDNPNMFRSLREVHEPKDGHRFGSMFNLGTRANFKSARQQDDVQ